jgi:tRNA pseudouridine65 synthase
MLELLYRDEALVAVNKPSGLLVHRSTLAPDRDTVMRRLRDQLGTRVHPLHRLDRGTSGVLLFALDAGEAAALSALFAGRSIEKRYLLIARGYVPAEGRIDSPLAEEPGMTPVDAVTDFRTLATVELPVPVGRYRTARYSLVEAAPRTGRMHQIRRHMAHIRHPVVGDAVHGDGKHNRLVRERFGVSRLLLHARSIDFVHPRTGRAISITAPLTDDLAALLVKLGMAW